MNRKLQQVVDNAILDKLAKLYAFPDLKHIDTLNVFRGSFTPYFWYLLNKPEHSLTDKEVESIRLLRWELHKLPLLTNSCLIRMGVIPTTYIKEVRQFQRRLSKLDINFIISGVGGAGMNAMRVFMHCNDITIYEDDELTLYDLLRMPVPDTAHGHKLDVPLLSGFNKVKKFLSLDDINENRRYLIYSSVEDGDLKNALSDLNNVIQVNVGFTGNEGGAGINLRQPITVVGYGNVDATVLKINAVRTAYEVVRYFNSLTDNEIEASFLLTKDICDVNAVEQGFVPNILEGKVSIDPTFMVEPYIGDVPFKEHRTDIYLQTVKEMGEALLDDVVLDFDKIPQLFISKVGNDKLINLTVTLDRLPRFGVLRDNKRHVFKEYFNGSYVDLDKCEVNTEKANLASLIATAADKHLTYPNTFIGGVLQGANGEINLLHPLCLEFLVKEPETEYQVIWYYLNDGELDKVVVESAQSQQETILSAILDVKENHLVEPDEGSGDSYYTDSGRRIVEFHEKLSSDYFLLGVDILIAHRSYAFPWYGYQVVDRTDYSPKVKILGDFGTCQLGESQSSISMHETSLCTGMYSGDTHGAIVRTHQSNQSSGYGSSEAFPRNVREAYHVAVSAGISYYQLLVEEQGA